jgi:hypothetical protein
MAPLKGIVILLYENVDWIDMAQHRNYWWDFTDIVMGNRAS